MGVAHRLSEYLVDMALQQKVLASVLKVKPTTISSYVKGTVSPTAEGLISMAEVMGVSIDWLLGQPTTSRWSPAVQRARMAIRAKATEISAADTLERMVRIIGLLHQELPCSRQEWFMAGILRISVGDYQRLLEGQDVILDEVSLGRFGEFTGLPEVWIMLGDPEYLSQPADLGDYANIALRLAELGITPLEILQNINRIHHMIQQLRRLGQA